MMTKLLHEAHGLRTLAIILETGEEAMAALKDVAATQGLTGASLTAIGAFERATLLYFDWETKDYVEIPVREQVEVASLNGDIGVDNEGAPALHVHTVLGRRNGAAVVGHLKDAVVRPTLEVIVTETPRHLTRRLDRRTGLNLIDVHEQAAE